MPHKVVQLLQHVRGQSLLVQLQVMYRLTQDLPLQCNLLAACTFLALR